MDPEQVRATFMEKFRQVAGERLAAVEELFARLCVTPSDADAAQRLLRELHTLKGESRMMGFASAGQLLHAVEDLLKPARESGFENLAAAAGLVEESLRDLSLLLIQSQEPEVAKLCERLRESAAGSAKIDLPASAAQAAGLPAAPAAPVDLARYRLSKVVRVEGDKLDALSDLAGELLGAHLRVRDLVTDFDDLLKSVKALVAASNGSPDRAGVGISQTDRVLGLRRDLARLRRQLIERTSSSAGLLDNLLDQIRQVRLLPIANLFQLHRSAVRDLARGCAKLVEVRIEGESTLVDRGILDVLSDVLLHLIRNALDHGLESPDERREQSKPEQGLLVLRARTVNDRVEVEIEDDGRGIDPARIAVRAQDRGLISASQASGLKSDDIIDLIFRAGFSTAEQTTETSGRGVGMDVVRARLQELGGAIRIDTTPGRGARFSLNLPTSISIARVLLFRAAGQVFGLLATFVDRVERIDPGSLMVTPAGRALLIDDQTIPAIEAAELIRQAGADQKTHRERVPVVVVAHGDRRIALLVDGLVGERELAIKPFCKLLSDIRAVSGVAVLQDSTLVLLLHAGELVQAAGSWAGSSRLRRMEQDLPAVRRVLLVEDSLITRELERSILTSFGLEVVDAGDGVEAIEALAQGRFDLVVSDVEMPRMDGLELTRKIKADERTADLPVILITTLGSDEDRRRGLQAGADGYLTKADFGSRTFMELVNRFLS